MALGSVDPNSFFQPNTPIVTHTHLNLDVNFEEQVLKGHVVLDIERKGSANTLILDIKGLILLSILNYADGSNLSYNVDNEGRLGSRLNIQLPTLLQVNQDKLKIKIDYMTSENSSALIWLPPESTADEEHPYLLSLCEAIQCRSVLPCQDTPSVKFTYSAEITAPKKFTVLMSALHDGVQEIDNKKMHKFHQPIPIPAYLLAITVAVLVSKDVGPRTKVWTEKKMIDAAAYEFAETELLLKTAEDICGPYEWGKYDLLVLPASYPFGGMENPCLTFVSPSIIAGDRSLASIIAHEIAHSWTGNLVTNANFEHFWLNEGITVFIERKIRGKLLGEENRDFEAIMGLDDLNTDIRFFGDDSEYTKLVTNLTGVDPDDVFSKIPYEKGHTFMYYLEDILGDSEEFGPFIKSYVDKFKYKSIVSNDFKDFVYSYFSNKTQVLNSIDWDAWFYSPGQPPVIPKYDKTLTKEYLKLVNKWTSRDSDKNSFSKKDIQDFTPLQTASFISTFIVQNNTLTADELKHMEDIYEFSKSHNAEIKSKWYELCVKARWEAKVTGALDFVMNAGRIKLIKPVLQEFYEWKAKLPRVVESYKKNKNKIMVITRQVFERYLHLDKE